MTEAVKDPTLVILKNVILSYPHLDKPQANTQDPNQKPKFSGAFVVTAEEQKQPHYAEAVAAAKAAAVDTFGAKAPAIAIIGGKGATIRNDTAGKGYPEGAVIVNARNESKPGAVYSHADGTGKPARVPDDKIKEVFYPGCIVNAQIRFYGYNKDVNKGVTGSLQNIQFVKDGERLDNRQNATEAFTADLNAVPADLAGLV